MQDNDDDAALTAYIEASAQQLGLEIKPDWMQSVKVALVATDRASRLVEAFPLPDDLEPAPVFRA